MAPKIPIVLIDSSIIRKHLFHSWSVLTCLAAAAREGRLTICLPWIVEQEVFSGIEDHLSELTAQDQFVTSVRKIAPLSSSPDSIQALCDQFEDLRSTICEEARARFRHWIETSQAEHIALSVDQAKRVFSNYFSGGPPFGGPKVREHIPDAFIYDIAMQLVHTGATLLVVSGDTHLREALNASGKAQVFREVYGLFSELGVSFNFHLHQARSASLPSMVLLNDQGRAALFRQLIGQKLPLSPYWTADSPIKAVLGIDFFECERQSVIDLSDSAFLIAFQATGNVSAIHRKAGEGARLMEIEVNWRVDITGHFVVDTHKNENGIAETVGMEVDDVNFAIVENCGDVGLVREVIPRVEVEDFRAHVLSAVLEKTRGLVVVIGSSMKNRRLVVEHLVTKKTEGKSPLGFLGFLPPGPTNLPFRDYVGERSQPDLWDTVRRTNVEVLGVSSEDAEWAANSLNYLYGNSCFIVATMKSANSRSVVVRHLAKQANGVNNLPYLLAVAWIQEATPERIVFAISEHGEWGDGSWDAILEHDALFGKYRRQGDN